MSEEREQRGVKFLLEALRALPPYKSLTQTLQPRGERVGLRLPRAVHLPLLAALHADLNRPVLFITDRADRALSLFDELGFWLESPRYLFAEPTPLFYEPAAWNATTRRERLQTLTALTRGHLASIEKLQPPPVIVTSVRSLMTRTLPRREFLQACQELAVGQRFSIEAILQQWARSGYSRVNTVLESGQFSRRGGILDVWPPAEPLPLRLEFFGDEIETIRRFDPTSQRTVELLSAAWITPAREFLVREAGGDSEFSEFHIPRLHPESACLLDYLPDGAVILLDNLSLIESVVAEVEAQAVKMRQESIQEGTLPPDFPVPYITWPEVEEGLCAHPSLDLGYSDGPPAGDESSLASAFAKGERFAGRLKPFIEHIANLISQGEVAMIVSRQAIRLQELWNERQANSHPSPLFVEASLSEGFVLGHIHLITDSEIFGWERPRPRSRPLRMAETPESAYADLQVGDYVVHIDHGIGRFLGLVTRPLDGHEREFLAIEYEDGGQLYVPVHQSDRLTRYVGVEGLEPSLDRLGGQEWSEKKRRAREATLEVAQELLDLYARRQLAPGYAFSPDSSWQKELEDSFPYVETEDQTRALAEIKRDMERPRPMDRLLCGDVGYGKTEIALRAAFKAVMDGKQVAMLVPTTVLAQQHYETFSQRLAAFPLRVEMLSRFRTPREQSQILAELESGQVDVIIGTHRLLSADVRFKDLGLVIIDEEQRFGVTHKEHLKRLRTEVDVLTLTATPIPRTLYMALSGVRDISSLSTPPEDRLPIATHVGPYSPKLVRQAILREMERGGQVFFVHNRVQTIEAMKAHLRQLVPQARIEIAHGQMPEQQLADVMHRFTAGEIDVLLSTSIIESGLDIPNANTLIVDRADAFGLAQLYQLRGRVGRGAMRAYAYFFRHPKIAPTPDGEQRLEVLAEHTQLGAGFSIAMRDLEMRGAGELLGTRQHGHIAAVGFHLYTRLLADAVRRLRHARAGLQAGSPAAPAAPFPAFDLQPISLPVNVDLPLPVGIPADYVPDQDLRLRLYRRVADLRDETEIEALASEFHDRFGAVPEMVENLFYQMRVKLRAERAGLASVGWEAGQIVLRYPASEEKAATRLPDLAPDVRGGRGAYWCTFAAENWKERLLDVLARLENPVAVAANH